MQNPRLAVTALRTIFQTADRYGVDIPIRETLQEAIDTRQRIAGIRLEQRDLTSLVVAAAVAGRDPATDPEVLAVVTGNALALQLGPVGVDEAADNYLAGQIDQHLDDVITAFKPAYAKLGRSLDDDHAQLAAHNVTDLTSASISMNAGPDTAAAHGRAVQTIHKLTEIQNALALASAPPRTTVDQIVRYADIADTPAGVINTKIRELRSPWDVVAQGWTLDLATSDQRRERLERAVQAQERAEQRFEAERQQAIRNTYGTGRPITV